MPLCAVAVIGPFQKALPSHGAYVPVCYSTISARSVSNIKGTRWRRRRRRKKNIGETSPTQLPLSLYIDTHFFFFFFSCCYTTLLLYSIEKSVSRRLKRDPMYSTNYNNKNNIFYFGARLILIWMSMTPSRHDPNLHFCYNLNISKILARHRTHFLVDFFSLFLKNDIRTGVHRTRARAIFKSLASYTNIQHHSAWYILFSLLLFFSLNVHLIGS